MAAYKSRPLREDRHSANEGEYERLLLMQAERAATRRHDEQVAAIAERDRCMRIAEQWPDNLMAKHIAELIRGGSMKSPSTHHYPMPILALLAALLRLKVRKQEQMRLKLEAR